MKTNNIIAKSLAAAALVAGGFAAASCTDWDDHYGVDAGTAEANATLWENIAARPELSDFAAILKKGGYDRHLSGSQAYTVWAPSNGSFDFAAVDAITDSATLHKEFIQNHIARNSYPASGPVDLRVPMLNAKSTMFAGAGDYTMSGVPVTTPNIPSLNGTMHIVGAQLPFRMNIYEKLIAGVPGADSVTAFYRSFHRKEFVEALSTPGPMVDGQLSYLDSVFVESNDLVTRYMANIMGEDSAYTMVVPKDAAWNAAKAKIATYLDYPAEYFNYLDATVPVRKNTKESQTKSLKLNSAYLRDSIVTKLLMQDLFYSQNMYGNKPLANIASGTPVVDSLVSTYYGKMYTEDAAHLFSQGETIEASNGNLWVTDELRMRPWMTWCQPIAIEAEAAGYWATDNSSQSSASNYYIAGVSKQTQNDSVAGTVSGNSYIEIRPNTSSGQPMWGWFLPNVMSTTYNVYVVTVPGNITDTEIEPQATQIRADISYYAKKTEKMTDPADSTKTINVATTSLVADKQVGREYTNAGKIDTLFFGSFTFPVSCYGISEAKPLLKLRVQNSKKNEKMLRIDKIILMPKELDDFIEQHPGYKYPAPLGFN